MYDLRKPVRGATILATALLVALPLYSMAQQDHPTTPPPHSAQMHERMQQRMQEHLDKLAARLEIRASQQEAWNAFSGAVRNMAPAMPLEPPAKDLDAASRARLAADRAAEHARKLGQLADATSKLQQVLDTPQKQVLNEVARRLAHHRGHHEHGDDGHDGVHDGMHEGMHGEHGDGDR